MFFSTLSNFGSKKVSFLKTRFLTVFSCFPCFLRYLTFEKSAKIAQKSRFFDVFSTFFWWSKITFFRVFHDFWSIFDTFLDTLFWGIWGIGWSGLGDHFGLLLPPRYRGIWGFGHLWPIPQKVGFLGVHFGITFFSPFLAFFHFWRLFGSNVFFGLDGKSLHFVKKHVMRVVITNFSSWKKWFFIDFSCFFMFRDTFLHNFVYCHFYTHMPM